MKHGEENYCAFHSTITSPVTSPTTLLPKVLGTLPSPPLDGSLGGRAKPSNEDSFKSYQAPIGRSINKTGALSTARDQSRASPRKENTVDLPISLGRASQA